MEESVIYAQQLINQMYDNKLYVNHTKLQKLLYLVYGIYAYQFRKPLFSELPRYFPYGPVFAEVLVYTKKHDLGLSDITEKFSPDVQDIMDAVLKQYGHMSAWDLTEWSHRDGSAWQRMDVQDVVFGTPLPFEYVLREFEAFLGE